LPSFATPVLQQNFGARIFPLREVACEKSPKMQRSISAQQDPEFTDIHSSTSAGSGSLEVPDEHRSRNVCFPILLTSLSSLRRRPAPCFLIEQYSCDREGAQANAWALIAGFCGRAKFISRKFVFAQDRGIRDYSFGS
jgi:hypothetical protein